MGINLLLLRRRLLCAFFFAPHPAATWVGGAEKIARQRCFYSF